MSYHLTVVRTNGKQHDLISKNEIISFLSRSDSYSFEEHGSYLNVIKSIGPGQSVYFIYQDGVIWIKNPDPEHVDALIEIAKALGGRVRGDEFETYISPNKTIIHPDDVLLIEQAKAVAKETKRNRNKRQFLINLSIFTLFALLALLIDFVSN